MSSELTIEQPGDFHCHLRQSEMCNLVTPLVSRGGIETCLVMPNTIPPISSTDEAVEYRSKLQSLAPDVQFLMTLYLSPKLTPEEIYKASRNGVKGVKSYPKGVTTNSDGGIESYESYYPIFEAMEKSNMVLNLHGEIPSSERDDVTVMNAEHKFLPQLDKLVANFPNLKIVVEHATTKATVEKVKSLPSNVGCTITPHHLELIVDDWAGQGLNFCKPVAKFWSDRNALREVIKEGNPKFFLGSDSAPHPSINKLNKLPTVSKESGEFVPSCGCAAGIYTSSILVPLCATILESFGALQNLENFVSKYGRNFYEITPKKNKPLRLVRDSNVIPHQIKDEVCEIVPFKAGTELHWKIVE